MVCRIRLAEVLVIPRGGQTIDLEQSRQRLAALLILLNTLFICSYKAPRLPQDRNKLDQPLPLFLPETSAEFQTNLIQNKYFGCPHFSS